jgi:hypothetical protein
MRVLLAAAFAVAASPALAQPLPVNLDDGAAWTMTVERSREGDAPAQAVTVKSSSALTWKKVGEAGELTTEITSTDAGAAEIAGALGLAHRPVRAAVDPALAPERIENWDEVREGLTKAMAKAVAGPKAAEAVEVATGVFAKLSAEEAAQVILRDQALAAISQGLDLELGQPVDYDDLLPNPLGGPPIKSQGRFELVSYDAAKGRAVVTWRQAFDQASATSSLLAAAEALLAQASPDQVDKLRATFQGAALDRLDTCRHEIDIPTGLAVRAACDTTIDITLQGETARNVDRWTITQSLPRTRP